MPDVNVSSLISAYEAGTSMRVLASTYHISPYLVRRILFDAGVYANETTIYAKKRQNEGASLDEIAAELKVSRNAILSNLPHTKGRYGLSTPTQNAERIRRMREKRKAQFL